ncbi:uncharacterized protein LOC135383196 [Ornithodoros turicata]|uniref:uncharacterized protein LOC135383196 n=1 Tax=Ornithodoros turicata TaxID=34597 RepID=UPI0031397432
MADITCLVEVMPAGVKRKCRLWTQTLAGLKIAVATCSVLSEYAGNDNDRYQIFDKDFDEFVELSPDDTIENMSRIRIVQETAQAAKAGGSAAEVAQSATPLSQRNETEQHAIQQDTVAAVLDVEDLGSINKSFYIEENTASDDDGKSYSLPQFGVLDAAIKNGEALKPSVHCKIVDLLFQSMVNLTIYPSKKFYFKAVNLLLVRYPCLTDVTGSGYDSWIVALRNKFKNERRKVQSNRRVVEAREQFATSRKRVANVEETDFSEETLQRRKVKKVAHNHVSASGAEDEVSITEHEQWLLKEAKRPEPDEVQVMSRMDATFSRRAAALAELPSISTVKERFPYLMDSARFCREYQRLQGEDPLCGTSSGLKKIRELAVSRRIKCKEDLLQKIEEAPSLSCGETRRNHVLAIYALQVICDNMKEPAACGTFFVKSGMNVPVTPCIVYSGNDISSAEDLFLYIDKEKLFRTINAEEGIAVLMSAYFILHIIYPKAAYNTACILERLCLSAPVSRLRPVAVKFFNIWNQTL